jgi:hypothetical protein
MTDDEFAEQDEQDRIDDARWAAWARASAARRADDADELRHNHARRTEQQRNELDKLAVPASVKVERALRATGCDCRAVVLDNGCCAGCGQQITDTDEPKGTP